MRFVRKACSNAGGICGILPRAPREEWGDLPWAAADTDALRMRAASSALTQRLTSSMSLSSPLEEEEESLPSPSVWCGHNFEDAPAGGGAASAASAATKAAAGPCSGVPAAPCWSSAACGGAAVAAPGREAKVKRRREAGGCLPGGGRAQSWADEGVAVLGVAPARVLALLLGVLLAAASRGFTGVAGSIPHASKAVTGESAGARECTGEGASRLAPAASWVPSCDMLRVVTRVGARAGQPRGSSPRDSVLLCALRRGSLPLVTQSTSTNVFLTTAQ